MIRKLIIFIKNPIIGQVKTRLAKDVGDKKALSIYKQLLQKTRKETLRVVAEKLLYYSNSIEEDEWEEKSYIKKLQNGKSLGNRMSKAFTENFSTNSSIIIIGSDCYNLTSNHIENAFDLLEKNDLVIGPSNDGGYYLLGINKNNPSLFENIDWSTDKVFNQTLLIAKRKKLKIAELEELIDLDTFEDLKKLNLD